MVVFGSDEEGYRSLVEPSALPVPFLDRIQGALSREIEHEEYSHSVIAHQRKHVDKLSLAAQIPD